MVREPTDAASRFITPKIDRHHRNHRNPVREPLFRISPIPLRPAKTKGETSAPQPPLSAKGLQSPVRV